MRITRLVFILFVLFILPLSACDCEDTGADSANSENSSNNADPDAETYDAGVDSGCAPGDPDCAVDVCLDSNCRPDQECRDAEGIAECFCPAGTTDIAGACEMDETCMPTTCGGHGTCTDSADGPTCSCDTGWSGDFCGACDEAGGFQPNGDECTDDPCDLLACDGDFICVVTDAVAACECPAGTHRENDICSIDQTCSSTSCGGNGTCIQGEGTISCRCDEGWAPPFCQQCDEDLGYHDDGAGGCTTDPCLPNPCTMANKTVCDGQGASFTCLCDAGYHDENGACVIDETCQTGANDSCNGNGTCDDTGGVIVCTCGTGYDGLDCALCDVAGGYHDDGTGICTQDPCLPNPCTDTNKTSCTSNGAGSAFVCECDAGFHPDGMGGCTDDPCTPNICAAMNRACRVTNGAAECFTPVCDDMNPCTDDALVQGACQYTDLGAGTPCSTTECTDGQTCSAGVCGGGTARNCDDGNACTSDTCDAVFGCQSAADDTQVPDDGIACTSDSCSNGIASHINSDALCDDALYCTGTETCVPSDPMADASGCLTTAIPAPPAAPGPCQFYGSCDEGTQSFPLMTRSTGSACDDGVYCTSGDTCNASGVCVGTFDPNCGSTTCTSTSAFPNIIDIPQASIIANFTIGGAPLPATSDDYYAFTFYAVAKDTGVRHYLANFEYDYSGKNLEGPFVTDRLIPGVYDILLDRYPASRNTATQIAPFGERILMADVVLTTGVNTLDIDVPSTQLTIDYTIDGAPLPATSDDYYAFTFYAVARDTGVRHHLGNFEYDYSGKNLEGPFNTLRLMPGRYDIVLDRYPTSRNTATQIAPFGERVLIDNLLINGASQTIDIDVPSTQLTINYTIGGAPLPATSDDYYAFTFYAVAADTGVRHHLGNFEYDYSGKNLEGPFNTFRLMPGTYDIVLDRYPASRNTATQIAPFGERVLIDDLVISGANQTIDIDVPATQLTINYTIDGAPLPATSDDYYAFTFYAVARDTGVRHHLGNFEYDYSGKNLEGPFNTLRLMPGTYDIVIDRYPASRNTATQIAAFGERVLIPNLVISGANQTIDIDVPSTQLTINYTIDGAPLPATSDDYYAFTFYAVARDTGVRHHLGNFEYDYSGKNLEGPFSTLRLMPGTYDVVIDRYPASRNTATQLAAFGERVLIEGLTISGANQTIAIDVPSSILSLGFTVNELPLPATSDDYYAFSFYATARDTGVRHYLANFEYDYSGKNLEGPFVTHRLIPGTYDILLDRYPASRNTSTQLAPFGERYLGVCVDVP